MAAIAIGLVSAAVLTAALTVAAPLSGVFTDVCDLVAIAGVVVSVGLLEGV